MLYRVLHILVSFLVSILLSVSNADILLLVIYVHDSLVKDHFWLDNAVPFVSIDCVSTASPIIFDFSTKFINESWANISVPLPHVNDDPGLFVLWGCVGLAVSKLVLSAVCIWVSISKCSYM